MHRNALGVLRIARSGDRRLDLGMLMGSEDAAVRPLQDVRLRHPLGAGGSRARAAIGSQRAKLREVPGIVAIGRKIDQRPGMDYWFPAKRYGWGWGWPNSWQGWVVVAAFLVLFGAGFLIFPPSTQLGPLLVYVGILTALLIAICWLKGEPRWRHL